MKSLSVTHLFEATQRWLLHWIPSCVTYWCLST